MYINNFEFYMIVYGSKMIFITRAVIYNVRTGCLKSSAAILN